MFSKTPLNLSDVAEQLHNDGNKYSKQKEGDFFSYLQIDGKTCCVYLNHIYKYQNYRFYQYEYDNDEQGVTLLVNKDATGIAVTYCGYILLLISGLWLLSSKLRLKGMLYLIIPVAAVWLFISQIKPMTPVLRSPMLAAHVSVIMVAYVLLLIIAVLSTIALIKEPEAKISVNLQFINYKLLFPATFLLAFGIFIGAVWANISWGRYWGWDSKETWALITLLVYSIPFHKQTFPKFQKPKFFHKYLLFAFLSVLMTFLGVSFLLGGMHSYL
jgi:ABC-type transport system involved in cytochrome c biogenesis permease subunit